MILDSSFFWQKKQTNIKKNTQKQKTTPNILITGLRCIITFRQLSGLFDCSSWPPDELLVKSRFTGSCYSIGENIVAFVQRARDFTFLQKQSPTKPIWLIKWPPKIILGGPRPSDKKLLLKCKQTRHISILFILLSLSTQCLIGIGTGRAKTKC